MSPVSYYQTKRLEIRRFQHLDFDHFFLLLTHPKISASLNASQFLFCPHLVKRFLEQVTSEKDMAQSWLLYSILDRVDYQFIGGCGLKIEHENQEAEIFYLLFPEYWGNGLAVEACRPILDGLLNQSVVQKVHAFIIPENTRAQRVVEKLGFKYSTMIHLDRYGQKRKVGQWILDVCVDLSVFNQS